MIDLLANLNEPQKQAVSHAQGPLLVLAGAGSGKTRVITRRVANLVAGGVAPWQVLAITFTNKAAREMADRVRALDVPHGATICTFHSLCAALLREFALEAGASGNYTIYDRDDQLRLVPPGAVHSAISAAKNDLKLPGQLAENAEGMFDRQVAAVYAGYQKLLDENNAMDFDDLLLRTAQLLERHEEVRRLLTDRYRYLLIDEYQDTNRAQYLLARAIASEHDNICVTGDPDQSIYAWRGADIRNILQFEKDYPAATVVRLEENYRSAQPILTAASALISNNVNRKAKTLWTARAGGEPVHVLLCSDEHEEAAVTNTRRPARSPGVSRPTGPRGARPAMSRSSTASTPSRA
ncbi:MAG: UvrD-helicase domain-containing protein [Planctomycetota bacterium]|nr:UvrD-helicase domain-containing protein [Planctomycetota bacterium]